MGLSAVIRSGVATAAKVTADLLCDIEHEAYSSQNSSSEARYAGAETRKGLVDQTQRIIKTGDGREMLCTATITFMGDVEIDPRDKLTLPNGLTASILTIEGVLDPATGRPYATVVTLG